LLLPARADVTIVQTIEGDGSASQTTMKVKGDKIRFEASPKLTTILEGKTGGMILLMNNEKRYRRISSAQTKAMAEMANKFAAQKPASEKLKLTPTGKKETINGYESEEYTSETAFYKARYWLTTKYPNYVSILKQLQNARPAALNLSKDIIIDYSELPGLPIRTHVTIGGKEIMSTMKSIKEDPLPQAEFSVPSDFQEVKGPDMGSIDEQNEKNPAAESSSKP